MKLRFTFIFIFIFQLLFAQTTVPGVEGWRIHASFRINNDLTQAGKEIVVGSENSMFLLNTESQELRVISRVNGMSDVSVKKVLFDETSRSIVIAYNQGNIDIFQNDFITNIPEIANRIIIGGKNINNLTSHKGKVYLACSFGVAVIDMQAKRIADTYQNIGPGGSILEVFDIAFYNNFAYISTPSGIFRANENSFNLSDFNSWTLFRPSSACQELESFGGLLYAVIDSTLETFDNALWSPVIGFSGIRMYSMKTANKKLLLSLFTQLAVFDENEQVISFPNIKGARAAILSSDNYYYALIDDQGLLKFPASGQPIDYISPSGPYGSFAQRIKYHDKKLWMAGDIVNGLGSDGGWGPRFTGNKNYMLQNNTYKNYRGTDPRIDAAWDIIDVAINPLNGNAFFASFGTGLIEMNENQVVAFYDTSNSSLGKLNFSNPGFRPLYVSGVDFDFNGNLWVSNFGAVKPISVRLANGNWQSFALPSSINTAFGFITCDDYGNKWLINTRGLGLCVFRENNISNSFDDQVKVLTTEKQNGALPSNNVFCVTNDKKGELWVGTSKGLCIFSNPGNVFKAGVDFDAQQIVIKAGLIFSNFLDDVPIYCIKVDNANRKWIGTSNGVWLVSADGYTVIRNFTRLNSPLLADAVYEIGIDEHTGEVFFVTEKGIVSYMGTATEGAEDFSNVKIYPNPVTPDYNGAIAITGLVEDCYVKITDLSGNLVYENRANGGMLTWDGMNYSGKKVATGVYLIFASDSEGSLTHANKLLIIR